MTDDERAREEYEYLWRHFAFNADQRLKAFNFFVVFAVFANGGVFAAIERDLHPAVLMLVGGFVCALAIVFWVIDSRSKALILLDVPGLRAYENRFAEHSRIFSLESRDTSFGYSIAFRTLFGLQFLFGIGVVTYGLLAIVCAS